MNAAISRLMKEGILDEQAALSVDALYASGTPLDEALFLRSGIPEDRLVRALSSAFGIGCEQDMESHTPSREFLSSFPAHLLLTKGLLPIREEGGAVLVATSRIFDTSGVDELRLVTGREFIPVLATPSEIERALRKSLGVGADTVQSLISSRDDTALTVLSGEDEEGIDITADAEDASIIRFVNQVLKEAIDLRATDVHFEPFENELRVRYRVDGVLQDAAVPADIRRFQAAIVSRLKILSSLDIAEKRLPQDGRIKLLVSSKEVDVRVSVIPMLHGEAVVLRLLNRSAALLGLKELGMSENDRKMFSGILELPHGIILVTGPTGSGKTTTLYAGLSQINNAERKIITIEDPIEYHLRGINQIQVSTKAGLTFARGLRSILRHDPDVVLVGEIRDYETAEISVQASLTGHLVFSTLHTNDAPGALTRLVDMGVEPYLVASSLEAILAQRLVRLICPDCKEKMNEVEVSRLRKEYGDNLPDTLYKGKGCRQCHGTGYRGRTGVFEFMHVSEEIRNMITERESSRHIRSIAAGQGMKSLREDGWRIVREGLTTVEEVIRVTKDERENGSPAAGDIEGGDPSVSS